MNLITRRRMLKLLSVIPFAACLPGIGSAENMQDFTKLKAGYSGRLKKILAAGHIPYIDIESSCNSGRVDIHSIARSMDQLNIGLMALSADIGRNQFSKGVRFDDLSNRLIAAYPDRFIPVGNGGQPPALTEDPTAFLEAQESAARKRQIMLFGEFEFRHYPSPRQFKRGDTGRDVDVPVDGPTGHRLFRMSEKTGLAFQIHYEIEDELLTPLEKMLVQYPQAKVIWCHLAQIRYIQRTKRYTPAYVEGMIRRYPNLYFDIAFGDAYAIYPPSGQRHARVWSEGGDIKAEWRDLIVAYPKRFLSALDLGQDRLDRIVEYDLVHRDFLKRLPKEVQHQVAYRSAWSLIFGEEFA